MKNKRNEEASSAGAISGVQGPGRAIFRHSGKDFERDAAMNELMDEAVKKRGVHWVVIDDETGAQKGAYEKREDAWKRQRIIKKSEVGQKKHTKKKKVHGHKQQKVAKASTTHKAPEAKKAPEAHKANAATHKESVINGLKSSFAKLLKEGSALTYVFEQIPQGNDGVEWENFLEKLSVQALLSDEKLKAILQNMAKSEVGLLSRSIQEIDDLISDEGFVVKRGNVDQDENGSVVLYFTVVLPKNNKKIKLAVKVDQNRPLLQFPEEAKQTLNTLADEESKMLRANLMYAQETILDKMEDLSNATEERNLYLNSVQEQIDDFLQKLDPLKITMLRYLLKLKYKGVK